MRTVAADKYAVVPAVRISAGSAGGQRSPDLAKLGANAWVSVWVESGNLPDQVKLQRFDLNGRKLGGEVAVGSGNGAAVAELAGGGMAVAWDQPGATPGMTEIKARIFDAAGNAVGAEFLANTQTGRFQVDPHVAGLGGGGFVVTWIVADDPFDHVKGQIFSSDGQKIGGEFDADDVATRPSDKLNDDVLALANGNFVVAWLDNAAETIDGNASPGTRAQLFDAQGNKIGGVFALNPPTPGTQMSPTLAALPGGGFVAAWSDNGSRPGQPDSVADRGAWVRIFDASGHPLTDAVDVGSVTGNLGLDPTIAVTATGFTVFWYETNQPDDGSTIRVRGQAFDLQADKIGAEFRLDFEAYSEYSPRAVALPNGAIAVAYWNEPPNDADAQVAMLFPTVHGTEQNDFFAGTPNRDFYLGYGGDDIAAGSIEDDSLDGGDGNDLLLGQAGNDLLEGGDGNDQLEGGAGNDILSGGAGYDVLRGGAGVDSFDGGDNPAEEEDDSGFGDWIRFDEARATQGVVADLRTGAIADDGFGNAETMSGIESLGPGTAFVDTFYGNEDSNTLQGAAGDLLYGFGGDDVAMLYAAGTADGGAGVDRLELSTGGGYLIPDSNGDGAAETAPEATAGWTVDLTSGAVVDGYGHAGTAVNFEDIEGSFRDDHLTGTAGANVLDGEAGDDVLIGGAGDDTYLVDTFADSVTELPGEGIDTIRTYLGTQGAVYVLPDNVENLVGELEPGQWVAGNGLNNLLTMQNGNDVLDLSAGGNDSVLANGGNDYLYFGGAFTAADHADGGAGNDTLALLGTTDLTLGANSLSGIEVLSLLSGTTLGGTGHVTYSLTMNDGNVAAGQVLNVFGGNLLSDETMLFNGLAESDGSFLVYGGAAADSLVGGQRNDSIVGGAGDDQLYGLGGNDWLEGGLGADLLRGGFGSDLFVYKSAAESTSAASDHIVDFEDQVDLIKLDLVDADSNTAGDQAFSFIGQNAFSHTAGELRIEGSGSNWFVQGDTDGDGLADLVIQVDTFRGYALQATNFML